MTKGRTPRSAARTVEPADGDLSASVEDYVKAIYTLTEYEPGASVATTDLAARVRVGLSTTSGMVRRLEGLGLVEHAPYRGVTLTAAGIQRALRVVRRHRLIELYLVQALGMSWDEVHEDAERLEHAVSDRVEARMAAALGEPEYDPHGDPIPRRDGSVPPPRLLTVATAPVGTIGQLARVSDHDPAILRYLDELGVQLGATVEVIERAPFDGPITIRVTGAPAETHGAGRSEPVERSIGLAVGAAMHLSAG